MNISVAYTYKCFLKYGLWDTPYVEKRSSEFCADLAQIYVGLKYWDANNREYHKVPGAVFWLKKR